MRGGVSWGDEILAGIRPVNHPTQTEVGKGIGQVGVGGGVAVQFSVKALNATNFKVLINTKILAETISTLVFSGLSTYLCN